MLYPVPRVDGSEPLVATVIVVALGAALVAVAFLR